MTMGLVEGVFQLAVVPFGLSLALILFLVLPSKLLVKLWKVEDLEVREAFGRPGGNFVLYASLLRPACVVCAVSGVAVVITTALGFALS